MLTLNKFLLATAILATTLTACDKKAPANADTKTATSTTTTTVTTTASSPAPVVATSSPTVTPVSSTTQPTTTASFPNSTTTSIVTQAVTAGTPEATVKSAFDAMMNGTAKQAASYYQVDIPDFDKVLAEQQPMVKQQLKHLELGKTEYNKDNTKAFIVGKLTTAASPTPQTVSYKLIKVNGNWKLVE